MVEGWSVIPKCCGVKKRHSLSIEVQLPVKDRLDRHVWVVTERIKVGFLASSYPPICTPLSLTKPPNNHFTKIMAPSNRDYNFQLVSIINFSILGEAFNNAHLDTSFASIDPKIMKLYPIEGTYPGI